MEAEAEFKPAVPLGEMPVAEAAAKLRAMGEEEVADALEMPNSETGERPSNFGPFASLLLPRRANLYMTRNHVWGFLPDTAQSVEQIPISSPTMIEGDATLRNSHLVLRLDRLRVASYPGGGSHHVLFEFTSAHHTARGMQQVRFNTTCIVREGEDAAIVGYPIFVGLGVGQEGIVISGRTVNVKNDDDLGILSLINSDVFKTGLKLASTFQPALAPIGQLVFALTESMGKAARNAVVQNFAIGLDFGNTAMGARLREGTYLATQVPPPLDVAWDWEEWTLDRHNSKIVRRDDRTAVFPYNYIAISVSRYHTPTA